MKLNGNKVLITGATAGIGKALAEKFCALDNHVIAVGRNERRLQELASQNTRIIPFRCDISSPSELNKLIACIRSQHPDINILINNAGVQYNCYLKDETYTLQHIDHEIGTNLMAPIKLIVSLLPVLEKKSNAAIVNMLY